jgi:uncharacterized protein
LPDTTVIIVISCVLFLATTVGATIGFGTIVLSLPFLSLFVDIKQALPGIVILTTSGSITLAIINRRHTVWPQINRILLWVAIGFPFGNYCFHYLPTKVLNLILGIFVIGVALKGLWNIYYKRPNQPMHPIVRRVCLIFGGFMHGALSAGGPPIVAYVSSAIHDKNKFRATLFALWSIMSSVLLLTYVGSSSRSMNIVWLALYCLPGYAAGLWAGQYLHRIIPEKLFRKIVFMVLLLAGLSALFR